MNSFRKFITLTLVASAMLAALSGCSTLEQLAATLFSENRLPGSPGINSFRLQRDGAGYSLMSIGRTVGKPIDSDQVTRVDRFEIAPHTTVEVLTAPDFAPRLRELLGAELSACSTLRNQLENALGAVRDHLEMLNSMYPLDGYPTVQVQIAPPGRGIAYIRTSSGSWLTDLTMPLAIALPEALISSTEQERCEWSQLFVADIANLLIHELFHVHSSVQRGNGHDMLTEEYLAYLIGLSARTAVLGKLPDQLVVANGGELSDDIVTAWDQVLEVHHSGRIIAPD